MNEGTQNFHVPLPSPMYRELREESRRTGLSATVIAREAIREWLDARRRDALREEILAYAVETAGTDDDLDESLEAAAVEHATSPEGDR